MSVGVLDFEASRRSLFKSDVIKIDRNLIKALCVKGNFHRLKWETNRNIKLCSLKSSENIQRKEGVPDSSVRLTNSHQ